MKSLTTINKAPELGFAFFIFILLISCGKKDMKEQIIGTWESQKQKITIRTEPERMKFEFVSDTTTTSLTINRDQSVSGNIGEAIIDNGHIRINWLLPPGIPGIAYTIKCDLKGKIFEKDPLEKKEVEFWVGPDLEETAWELRYTTDGAQYPMAGIYFNKIESK